MEAIQAELSNLTANGRQPTPAEVEQVLAKMQANQGTSVVNGVDLGVLRNNLRAADRMLTISNQVQTLAQNPTPENSQKLQNLMSELQRLQASMNANVLVKKP